jgi:starvation-inducible DNA-binding protein
MTVFLGISQDHLEKIAEAIKEILSDTVLLALKTKGFHWNVTGSDFWQLHEMFDKQHAELSEGVDKLAERIRALSKKAPGSFHEFNHFTKIKECKDSLTARKMVQELLTDHEEVVQRIRLHITALEATKDYETIDMLTERLFAHGKFAWTLRSYLI